MGQHDPLDGFVTFTQLETSARGLAPAGSKSSLAIADFAAMMETADLWTVDPLGLGGLLSDACRVEQLASAGAFHGENLLERLLQAAQVGLSQYVSRGDLGQPASRRLAFRELGLAIGLSAIELIEKQAATEPLTTEVRDHLAALSPYAALGTALESFWLDAENRNTPTWSEHRDINEVTLATRLVPEGYLVLPPG
jgi:hypothetical protein